MESPIPLTPEASLSGSSVQAFKRVRLVLAQPHSVHTSTQADSMFEVIAQPSVPAESAINSEYSVLDLQQVPTAPSVTSPIVVNNQQSNDLEARSPREIFNRLMSRYLESTKTINNLFTKIESIPDGEFVLFNDLMRNIPTAKRPTSEMRMQIIDDLRNAQFIIATNISKTTSIKIEKGPIFP